MPREDNENVMVLMIFLDSFSPFIMAEKEKSLYCKVKKGGRV